MILYGKNVFNSSATTTSRGARLSAEPIGSTRLFGLTPPATYGVEFQFRFR